MSRSDSAEADGVRIAMWSGPRNISTAMMRAWENRPDTVVTDEPFYGHYLQLSGSPHPGAEEVIAAQGTDWRRIAEQLAGPVPRGRGIHYQKHMTHHLLPNMERAWMDRVSNCFLIRSPAEVISSYARTRPRVILEDVGMVQQAEIFEHVRRRTGRVPPVLDARDVLADPRRMLTLLCEAVGVPFSERMLAWPPGPRASDGVWAKHWYASVERSTGFRPYAPDAQPLPEHLRPLAEECEPHYRRLWEERLGR